jgi:hypothetical protein
VSPEDRIFHTDDAVLVLPKGFTDRSVHVLDWPLDGGDKVALVIQRERIAPDRPFDDYVDAELKDYPRRFAAFRREKVDEAALGWDGADVRHHAFRWKKEEDVFYNRQAFLRVGTITLVMTATAKAAHRVEVDEVVVRALEGFKLRED